jgi:hypothetical protein
MRISKDSKLGVALGVLRKVKIQEDDLAVKMYSNCREQGFYLISYCGKDWRNKRAVSFAEYRNSDRIVVQYGTEHDFNDYGAMKEEEVWRKQRKFFDYGDWENAGEFITKWLKK